MELICIMYDLHLTPVRIPSIDYVNGNADKLEIIFICILYLLLFEYYLNLV